MHFSTTTLTQVVFLVGLPGLVVAEPIPANYIRTTATTTSQGATVPKTGTGGLLNLNNVLGGVRGGNGGGLLNLGGTGGLLNGLLGSGGSTGNGGGTGGNNGGSNNGGNNGGLNVGIGNGGLLGQGGVLGSGLHLGNGKNGLLGGIQGDIGVDVSLGGSKPYSVKDKRGESEVEGEVLDEVLVKRQRGDASNALKLQYVIPKVPTTAMDGVTDLLYYSNEARKKKNLPALAWDTGLEASAKAWANNLVKLGKLQHASGTGQGENLAYYK